MKAYYLIKLNYFQSDSSSSVSSSSPFVFFFLLFILCASQWAWVRTLRVAHLSARIVLRTIYRHSQRLFSLRKEIGFLVMTTKNAAIFKRGNCFSRTRHKFYNMALFFIRMDSVHYFQNAHFKSGQVLLKENKNKRWHAQAAKVSWNLYSRMSE